MNEEPGRADEAAGGVQQQAAARGTLALGLAIASLVLGLIFVLSCPGLSCVSFALAGVSVLLAYAGLSQARDGSIHIAAIAVGALSAVLSLTFMVLFGLLMAVYGGVLSVMLLNGP